MAYYDNKNQSNRNYNNAQNTPKEIREELKPLGKDYVQHAENVIKYLKEKDIKLLTTTQIRNILSMLNAIYNTVVVTTGDTLSEDIQNQLQYLKVKLIYAAGRHKEVKNFILASDIDRYLDNIGDSKEAFILYSRYMEALVAYHRFYGGRD